MYCLSLFYKNYIVYNVYRDYCGAFNEKYVSTNFALIGCCVSELHGHLCPYCNVRPGAIFTRATLFNELFKCWYDQS